MEIKASDYIEQQNKILRANIDEYSIGQSILDADGAACIITNISFSSIEVFIKNKTNKGINHKEWFYIKDFNSRFALTSTELKIEL